MKDFEFYQNLDLRYPELAICLEDSKDGVAKFFIPVLTPILDKDKPYDEKDININKLNILNNSTAMEIDACISSNYLELHLPHGAETCIKGDIFVIVFVGGDPNKPFILGRYYDAIYK